MTSPKFLLVDDDPSVLDLLGTMVSAFGCQCESANGGQQAIDILKSPEKAREFDAIFLDIMMPGVDGYQVLKNLREQPHTANIPIIMLTALDNSSSIMSAYQTGANYYIPKPFTSEQVIYGLDMILGENHAEEEGGKKNKVFKIPENW